MSNSSSILEVNLKNFIHNYKVFKKYIKNKKVAATIKANAYGIGDKKIFAILYKNGCRHFFVATLKEGLKSQLAKARLLAPVLAVEGGTAAVGGAAQNYIQQERLL